MQVVARELPGRRALVDFPCASLVAGCRPQLLCHQPTIQNYMSFNPHTPLHTACTLGRAWLIAFTNASKAKQVPMKASVDKIHWNVDRCSFKWEDSVFASSAKPD